MIQEEVLFQGTWAEALEHPERIPAESTVQIVSLRRPEPAQAPEEAQAQIEELLGKLRALPPDADQPAWRGDPYYNALVEKYREQGLELP